MKSISNILLLRLNFLRKATGVSGMHIFFLLFGIFNPKRNLRRFCTILFSDSHFLCRNAMLISNAYLCIITLQEINLVTLIWMGLK